MQLILPALLLAAGTTLIACNNPAAHPGATRSNALPAAAAASPAAVPDDAAVEIQAVSPADIAEPLSPEEPVARRNSTVGRSAALYLPGKGLLSEVQQVMPATATFSVNPAQPYHIEAAYGTTVVIPANAFVVAGTGERPAGPVTVRVQECSRTADILTSNLSTCSGGTLLETGGMLYIDAQYEGQRCTLAPGRALDLSFPYTKPKPDMQLFTGTWTGRQMDWSPLAGQRSRFVVRDWEPADGDEELGAYFPSAEGSFTAFCQQHLQWPTGVDGPITVRDVDVSFVINEFGAAERVRVHNAPSKAYEEQVAEAFANMPCWVPGERRGQPKANAFRQRITFWWPFNAGTNDSLVKVRVDPLHFDSLFTIYSHVPGRYRLRSTALGWINCDRFYNEPGEKVNFYVDAGSFREGDVKLVFHSMRSILQGTLEEGRFVFRGVPAGLDVTVVAVKVNGSGYELAMKECKTSADAVKGLAFETVSLGCLKEKLSKLDDIGLGRTTAARPAPPAPMLAAAR